nr:MAG TPA: INTRON-ENCODED ENDONUCLEASE I-SCEI [Bacteriophage sp.]
MKLNDLNKSILIGLLLGDGYIDPKGRIYIEHCKE